MKPHQFNPDHYHPEGELFVVNPKDKFAPGMIKAYQSALSREAAKLDRRKAPLMGRDGKPVSYWLRKKAAGAGDVHAAVVRFQAKHPEMVKYPD